MIQEHVPAFYKGWYNDFIDPNLEIRDGFLHAPQIPGMGTRLRPEVRDRSDVSVRASDKAELSPIDHWSPYAARSAATEAEVQRLLADRKPQDD